MCVEYEEIIRRLTRIENRQEEVFNGTPGHPETGLVVRMDRLEEAERRRKWTVRTLIVAVLGLMAELVRSFVKA